jgi:hypothetical protein
MSESTTPTQWHLEELITKTVLEKTKDHYVHCRSVVTYDSSTTHFKNEISPEYLVYPCG